jgi:3-oxoacyl-[acyl-carrier protein] reductase
MDLGLQAQRVLVTGASRGIGRAIARTFAEEGAAVAMCARGPEGLADVDAEIRAMSVPTFTSAFDVTDPDALTGFVEDAAAALGGLDVVVSNVSAGNSKGPEQWQNSLDGDLIPFVRLAEAAVPHLEPGGGAIIAIGTTNAWETTRPAGPNAYSALKAAVLHHAAALAHSLAPKGIRVNTVSPGPIEFPGGDWDKIRTGRPEVYAETRAKIALSRFGTPDEVAAAVVFLASPRAGFCTGCNLVVDGGLVTRVQF